MASSDDIIVPPVPTEQGTRSIRIVFNEAGETDVQFDDTVTVFDFASAAFLCTHTASRLAAMQEAIASAHNPMSRLEIPGRKGNMS